MVSLGSTLLLASSFLTGALAISAECLVAEIKDVVKVANRLDCEVEHFHSCPGGPIRALAHDVGPLTHIWKTNVELESVLENVIDDVLCSCNFNAQSSEMIVLALGEASMPIANLLTTMGSHVCEFERAVGHGLTHHLIGGSLKRTRFLTMDMLHAIECKLEDDYKQLISAASMQIDAEFQKVICKY